MKKFFCLLLISSLIILSNCSQQNQNKTNNTSNKSNTESEYSVAAVDLIKSDHLIANIEKTDLSDKEKEGLILMREEEKLAEDIYQTLGAKWNLKIFNNIAESEQTHTNAIKYLLDRYEIENPVTSDEIGKYQSQELQKLYDDLVTQGNKSLLDALIVGATVEDLDIKDLENLLNETDNEDIIITYQNLQRGSRNHMRAFIKQIERNGGTYTPQYISQETYESIIQGQQETGQEKTNQNTNKRQSNK